MSDEEYLRNERIAIIMDGCNCSADKAKQIEQRLRTTNLEDEAI